MITADEGVRGGRKIPLKANTDAAIDGRGLDVKTIVVVKRTGGDIGWNDSRDVWYGELTAAQSADCPPEPMNAE